MIRQVLSQFPHGVWSAGAMLLFIAVFVGVFFWIYRQGSSAHYNALAQTLLTDNEHSPSSSKGST